MALRFSFVYTDLERSISFLFDYDRSWEALVACLCLHCARVDIEHIMDFPSPHRLHIVPYRQLHPEDRASRLTPFGKAFGTPLIGQQPLSFSARNPVKCQPLDRGVVPFLPHTPEIAQE